MKAYRAYMNRATMSRSAHERLMEALESRSPSRSRAENRPPRRWLGVAAAFALVVLTGWGITRLTSPGIGGQITPPSTIPALEVTAATVSPGQSLGVEMTQLDYASDKIVIFHDYFGLFVYDLEARKLIRRVDLAPLGCQATQGDDTCDVTVSPDGGTVQLHPMSSKKMYVYSVAENTLREEDYAAMEPRFVDFVDTAEVVGAESAGSRSHNAVRFAADDYGFLQTNDWTVDTLTYVRRGNRVYQLFASAENPSIDLDGEIADETRPLPDRRQSQVTAYLSDLFTKTYSPYYGGLRYKVTDYTERGTDDDTYCGTFQWTMYFKANGLDVPAELGKETEVNFYLQVTGSLDAAGLLDLSTIKVYGESSGSGEPTYDTPIEDFFPGAKSTAVTVTADFATPALLNKYSSLHEFKSANEPQAQQVLFTTNAEAKDFKFLSIDHRETDEGIAFFASATLYSLDQLLPEKPLVVTWLDQGVIPHSGISFVDETGTLKYFLLSTSGEDGSLLLINFENSP